MSEGPAVTAEDVGLPENFDVKVLTKEFLDAMTDNQANYVRNMVMRRKNMAIYEKVMEAMKGQEQKIIEGLARFPPVYISPDIEILTSVKVSFRSLITMQNDDAVEAANEYSRSKSPSEFQLATYLNRAFLAHGLERFNGDFLAQKGLTIDLGVEQDSMVTMLGAFRVARMNALNMMSPSLVQVLIDANQAFQEFYDGVVSLRGSPQEIEAKVKRLVDGVGKSTGPHTAGQKQT